MRDTTFKDIIWQQFGAAIDMLENALVACPDELWGDRSQKPEFWYMVYHTLFFLDLYLSDSLTGFAPPMPFNLDELDPAGKLPDRPYTKEEMQTYLEHGRRKCKAVLAAMTEEKARQRCGIDWHDFSTLELHLYNMRHVQHHAGQLNLLLRQTTGADVPRWVKRAGR